MPLQGLPSEGQTLVPGKVFLGGLPQSTTDESLRAALTTHARCAPVDCHVMMDGKTGRSRGFGFAVFASPANAKMVVQSQPVMVDGREVTVSECWEKGSPAAQSGSSSMQAQMLPKTDIASSPVALPGGLACNREQLKIFVGGLSQYTTKESLDTYFAQFGHADSYIMMDKISGRSRGFGFVNFQEELALAGVLQMNHEIDGVPVTVSLYEPGAGAKASVERAANASLQQQQQQQSLSEQHVVPAARDQLKIFVGGLSPFTTKQSLDEYFAQFGHADSFIMTDRATGRSRGFGFVNFSDRQVMDGVLQMMHEVDGVTITASPYASSGFARNFHPARAVAVATPPPVVESTTAMTASLLSQVEEKLQGAVLSAAGQQQQRQQHQQHGSQGQPLKIFVGGLAQHTTKESLDTYFAQFGHANSYVMMDKASGRSRGFGFVNFTDENVMGTVLSFQHEIDGQIITCSPYEDKAGGGAGGDAAAPGGAALGSTVKILNNTIAMISKLRGEMESQVQTEQPQLQLMQQQAPQLLSSLEPGLQSSALRLGAVKLFVGGLAPTTTSDVLRHAFTPYECTEAEVITDKFTGRSRGFGFVSCGSPESAAAAMQAQHVIEGRPVEVSECWEKGAVNPKRAGSAQRFSPY